MDEADHRAMFGKVDEWVTIEINGDKVKVPKNQTLMRILQFLHYDLHLEKVCWNGSCLVCPCTYRDFGEVVQRKALACKLICEEGMSVDVLPTEVINSAQ